LFELYAANEVSSTRWDADEVAVWDLTRLYDPSQNRGISCTSADAAGFPITQGLIRVDEVVTIGRIDHALRFILPNSSMRDNALVPPATHIGGPSSSDPNAPPYGIRLRLKPDFEEDVIPSEGGKVVVRALKQYGMLLSDGGQIALTAERDDYTTAKWGSVLGARDLRALGVTDFEVVDFGTVADYDALPDCVLDNPLPP
jgi:serine/threonine-protein kinase